MGYVSIYPPSASRSQPAYLPGTLTSLNASGAPAASLSVRQTASELNQWNGISEDHTTKSRDVSELSQQSHFLDQRCRNNVVKEQGFTGARNSSDSGDGEDFPEVDELLSGMIQKNDSARADPGSGDDDGFVDIDELLSGIKHESIDSGSMAEKVDSGTRGSSPADSTRSTEGSRLDPIMLSDDESVGAESETDYSDLDVGPRAKRDSGPAADHSDDGNKSNGGVVNDAQLRLSADRPGSASPGHGSVTHRASKLRVNTDITNTDITQGGTSYVDLDVTKELEDRERSVSAKERGKDGDDTRSTKGSKLSAVSGDNPAFDGSMSELRDDQPDHTQSPQPGPAAASLYQSDWEIGHLPKQLRRRGATGDVCRKRPRTAAPTGLASTASTVSASLGPTDLEGPQSAALLAAASREREIRDIDQEMVDDGGTDDSNDEDYGDESDAAASEILGPPNFRKRARRAKDTEHSDVESPSTHSLSVSYQATAATLSGSIQESEEIPIRGYLTLKTIESKVVYCLTFSQDLLPEPRGTPQRKGTARSVSRSKEAPAKAPTHHGAAVHSKIHQAPLKPKKSKVQWTEEEDAKLLRMWNEGRSWEYIFDALPNRSEGTIRVRCSTKFKKRPRTGTCRS